MLVWEDVEAVVSQISGYLIAIGIALIALIVVLIFARKLKKPKRGFVRWQSFIAFLVVVALVANLIVFGPLNNLIATTFADMGDLTEETVDNSQEVTEEVTSEGIVMTENDEDALPLDTENVNVFGWASTNPVYGGTGSGDVDSDSAVDMLDGLENAGYNLNTQLTDMYTEYSPERPQPSINDGQDWTLPEPPVDEYSDEMIDEAQDFSDTAILTVSRLGGEGADLPTDMGAVIDGSWNDPDTKYFQASYNNNSSEYDDFDEGQSYLELSQTEEDLVDMVTDNFDNVVVVYNGSNPMEMNWIDDYEEINGALLIGGAGESGFNALGEVLSGEVNPSGKTTDTWVSDLTNAPYYNNIGNFPLEDIDDVTDAAQEEWPEADGVASLVNYVEDIYVGYRFYETADEEDLIDYDSEVQYPFGYGLSYTDFSQEMGDISEEDGEITVDVEVENTGEEAGKEVVQLYFNPPYTNGGLEKASKNLAAFDKTEMLEPGETQTVTLSFPIEDMESYDTSDDGQYVLEEGDYEITLQSDSHNVIDEQTYTVDETTVYDEDNPRSSDEEPATNELQSAEGEVTYLSRENGFENYEEATAAPEDFEIEDEIDVNGTYDPSLSNDDSDEMPTQEADNGLEVDDLRGVDYDDPRWDDLIDQMSVDEMNELIANGGFGTIDIDSIGLARTQMSDGPAGIRYTLTDLFGTGFPSEYVIAQTWNKDLAYDVADGIMREADDFGFSGWYAPSMNLHRSAFNGRNFEYYSEDPILSADMAINEIQASYDHGIIPFAKHFAFNEQETNRNAILTTWSSEQAGRELWLKPFEKTVKANDGSPLAMMSVFNFIGPEWGGSTTELLNNILRDEWGFQGPVITDYFGDYGYMNADRAIRGGSDLMLGTTGGNAYVSDDSATSVLAMREASKNIIYAVANSSVYEDFDSNERQTWEIVTYSINGALIVLLVLGEFVLIRSFRKKKSLVNDNHHK